MILGVAYHRTSSDTTFASCRDPAVRSRRMAELLDTSPESIALAGQRLREGRLCAFPTETVYGLGANALDEVAAKRIFEVKGRPPTDPLICHVLRLEQAEELWAIGQKEMDVAKALSVMWPGPLTVVANASAKVPEAVTGSSGFVGVRIPNHPVAQALLQAASVPVAAPSANLFGHVSPTCAQHVMGDLALRDQTLTVIDGGRCSVGIESTVVKIVSQHRIEVLRRGCVTQNQVRAALQSAGIDDCEVIVRDTRSKATAKSHSLPQDGPGQLLTHYSPNIPAFLVNPSGLPLNVEGSNNSWVLHVDGGSMSMARPDDENGTMRIAGVKIAVIDFDGILASLEGSAMAYRSLSATGDGDEAAAAAFDCLRWSENVDGAEAVIFPLVTEFLAQGATNKALSEAQLEVLSAVEDRLYRAASGSVGVVVFE